MVWNMSLSLRPKLGFKIPVLHFCNLVFHALTIWPERSTTQRRALSTKVFMYWKKTYDYSTYSSAMLHKIVKNVRKFSTISFEPNMFPWIISMEQNLVRDLLVEYYEKILYIFKLVIQFSLNHSRNYFSWQLF